MASPISAAGRPAASHARLRTAERPRRTNCPPADNAVRRAEQSSCSPIVSTADTASQSTTTNDPRPNFSSKSVLHSAASLMVSVPGRTMTSLPFSPASCSGRGEGFDCDSIYSTAGVLRAAARVSSSVQTRPVRIRHISRSGSFFPKAVSYARGIRRSRAQSDGRSARRRPHAYRLRDFSQPVSEGRLRR